MQFSPYRRKYAAELYCAHSLNESLPGYLKSHLKTPGGDASELSEHFDSIQFMQVSRDE